MKIILEFPNLKDLTVELPKFAAILNQPIDDYVDITPEEKDHHITIGKGDEAAEASTAEEPTPKQKSQKQTAQKLSEAADVPWETEVTKSTPATENAVQKATDADVRAALNDLLKKDRRDAVKKILKSFGASNFSGLAKENYAAAIEAARGYLAMSDEEYKEAIKK